MKLLPGNRKLLYRIVSISIAAAVAGAVLISLRSASVRKAASPIIPDSFDVNQCVRLLNVGRVYRIKPWDIDSLHLWFATAEGIRILDQQALQWTRIGLDHGLPSETISDLCFAHGNPWVATWNGLGFSPDSGKRFVVPCRGEFQGTRILSIEYHRTGVYAYVDGRGLVRVFHPDSLAQSVEVPGLRPTDRVTCLRSIGSDLYIGTEARQLFVIDSSRRVTRQSFEREGSKKTLVWDVLFRDGSVWVATSDDGLWKRDAQDSIFRPVKRFPAKGAYCFAPEKDGFWCGTPFGLWRYHDDGQVWIQFIHPDQSEPTDFQVFSLWTQGVELWYGSMDLGAGYLTKENVEWRPMRAGLTNPNVAALIAQDSFLFTGYGYQGGYLDRFYAPSVQYDRNYGWVDHIGDDHVQSFALHHSLLLYGTYRGLGYIDLDKGVKRYFEPGKQMPYGDIAQIVYDSSESRFYLAGQFGALAFDPKSHAFSSFETPTRYRVTTILVDGQLLWLGTLSHGLQVLDRNQGTVRPGGIGVGPVVLIDWWSRAEGKIFLATKEDGCYIIDREGNSRPLRIALPRVRKTDDPGSEFAGHILAGAKIGGHFWLGTRNAGAWVVSAKTRAVSTLTSDDGLVSNQVRSFAESKPYVWIGSYGGVSRFTKDYISRKLPD